MKIKLLLIILFLTFVSLPAIQYFHPFISIEKVDEKRKKVEKPQGNIIKKLYQDSSTAITIEKYFSDHFPLRDLLLRINAQFEYSMLNRAREVVIGKNGWLCDKKVLIYQLPELDKISDNDIKKAIIKLKKLEYYLNKNGTKFLMVIIPMKPTVYPEMFPSQYTKRPNLITLQRFQNALHNNEIPYIDALKILKIKKLEEDVYFKTDMHFNSVGSAYISKAMIEYFYHKEIDNKIWNKSFTKNKILFKGGEAKTMPTLISINENTPTWSIKNVHFTTSIHDDNNIKAGDGFIVLDKGISLLPPSIMFGNSFMLRYPSVGYNNYFTESSRVLDYEYFRYALDYIRPKHKIFTLHIYETQLLFHLLNKLDSFNYWDKRIDNLPLPENFMYKELE